MPKISVIIPCYNYGQYLEECIDSVLASTFHDFEILVIDDGSTDENTIKVLDSLDKPKTRLIRQNNKGLAGARNQGISEAKAEFFLPLDADDMISPDLLEKFFLVIRNQPEIGFVYSWVQMFGDKDDIWYTEPIDYQRILVQNQVCVCSLVRKKALQEVKGYKYNVPGWEDWDLWISLLKAGWKGYLVPETLFFYRKHGKSMIDDCDNNSKYLMSQIKKNHPDLYEENCYVQLLINQFKEILINNKEREDSLVNKLNESVQQYEKLAQQYEMLAQQHHILKSDHDSVLNSQSWKITKPLRLIKSFFK